MSYQYFGGDTKGDHFIDFMDFAGMASEFPCLIDEIISNTEANRSMALERPSICSLEQQPFATITH